MKHKSATKFTLLLLSVHTIMAAAIIAPSLPDLAQVFASNPNAELLSKLVLSLPALFIALSAPLVGHFIDRKGRLKLLTVGLILYGFAGSSGYFLNDLYHILIGRVVLGISIGVIMTVAITLIGDYFVGDERRKFIGTQSAFIGFAGVGFLAIGGFLADVSWRMPFLIYLLALLMLPLIAKFLPEPPANNLHEPAVLQINKLIRIIFVTAIAFMILFYVIPTQLPFLLKEIGIEGNSKSGIALGTNALGVVISSLGYARIRSRLHFPYIYAISFSIMAIGFLVTAISSTFSLLLFAMLIAGIGFGLIVPNTNLWIIELSRSEFRGRNLGALSSCLFLGQFLSPLVAQPLVKMNGLTFLFGTSAVIMIIMSLSFLLMGRLLIRMNHMYRIKILG